MATGRTIGLVWENFDEGKGEYKVVCRLAVNLQAATSNTLQESITTWLH